ncbi:hypothetical protein FACS189418_0890 [Clostridia bacterium]|nr:hypothetical protein FACS189418_0890 [Clostridia bacterium]
MFMKTMLKFILPLWLAMAINTLLSIADNYLLNQYNANFISVKGLASLPVLLLSTFFIGLGIECNRRTASEEKFSFFSSVAVIFVFAVLAVVIALCGAELFLFYTRKHLLYLDILSYYRIFIWDLIPLSILYLCTGLMRGSGKPQITVVFSALTVVCKVLFNQWFVHEQLLNSPLLNVALATVLCDVLIILLYLLYIRFVAFREKLKEKAVFTMIFFRQGFSYSIEKFLSSSSMTIISRFFLVNLIVEDSNIYYNVLNYFDPILMLPYAYFEWVLYATTKGLKNSTKTNTILYTLLLCGMRFGVYRYLGIKTFTQDFFLWIYLVYSVLFLAEREVMAKYFAMQKANFANRIVLFRAIFILGCFFFLQSFHQFHLLSLMGVQIVGFIFEILVLQYQRSWSSQK